MKEYIKVLIVEPNKAPYTKEIKNDLKTMQNLVGGFIECIGLNGSALAIVNEEGKIMGLPLNRGIGRNGRIFDIIFGNMVIVGADGCDFGDLSEEDIETYTEMFKKPTPKVVMNWIDEVWNG